MNSILLKILDTFRFVFRLFKVDYEQLRAIVNVKLLMDNRRHIVAYGKQKDQPGNAFAMALFLYTLMGAFVGFALVTIPSFMLGMIVFFSYVMVMVAMTLITDFSSVLLDTSDNTIILPRPVAGRTLFAARLTHIMLYIGQLTAALALVPAGVMLIQHGLIFLFFFLLATVFAVLIAVVLTNCFYLLIMQFAGEEKIRNVINYFQIVMAIAIMGGYQLMPRMMGRWESTDSFELQWWGYLLPPVWLGGALETVHLRSLDLEHAVLSFCAIVVPLSGFYLVNKYLTPSFARKLSSMGTDVAPAIRPKTEKASFDARISALITRGPFEQGSFEMIYKILGRDRKLKLKIYPAFGYIVVLGIIFLFQRKEDISTLWSSLPETSLYIPLLYLGFLVMQIALHELPYSDDYKASVIYFSTPLEFPGEILVGMIKAIFVRLLLPAFLIATILILVIWGAPVADDIVFGFFNNFLMIMILAAANKKHLPLSMAPSVRGQSGNFIRAMITLIMIGILGFGHYLLSRSPWLVTAAIPFQIVVIYLIVRAYRKIEWSSISF